MADRLRVALVGGPMYDSLYEPFLDDVEVVVHADHPTLNRRVAELLAGGERIDVRLLWWRSDRMPAAPSTWADLADGEAVFGFTGRESGLFGLFFELVVGHG